MPSGRRANRVMQTQHVVRPRRRDDATAASAGHTTARGLGLTAPHHKLRASGLRLPHAPAPSGQPGPAAALHDGRPGPGGIRLKAPRDKPRAAWPAPGQRPRFQRERERANAYHATLHHSGAAAGENPLASSRSCAGRGVGAVRLQCCPCQTSTAPCADINHDKRHVLEGRP